MKIEISKNKIYLSVFLFIYIFAPPVIKNLNIMYIVSGYSTILLSTIYKGEFYKFLKNNKSLVKFNIGLFVLLLYWSIIIIINFDYRQASNYLSIAYRFLSIIAIIEPPIIYIVLWCKRRSYTALDFFDGICKATMIEFVFCFAAILSPSIKAVLTKTIIENTGYYGEFSSMETWQYAFSYYGFSAQMSDYLGYGIGLIAGICLYLGMKINRKYYKYILFFLFITVMNAMTGIVIFGLSVLIVLLTNKKIKISTIIILLITPFVALAIMYLLSVYYPKTIQKLVDNFWEIVDPSKVQASNTTIRILLSDRFWRLPETASEIIFGTGHSLIRAVGFAGSDVGYINDIWSYGLIGSGILYYYYIKYLWRTLGNNRGIVLFLAVSFFTFNIKGLSVGLNLGMMVFMLVSISVSNLKNKRIELDDFLRNREKVDEF